MKRIVSAALAAALALAGCAGKQVREEGAAAPEVKLAPAPSPAPALRGTEGAPRAAGAAEPAPHQAVAGGGLARATTAGLSRIQFDFDQAVLRPDAREVLAANAEYLKANPAVRVRIEGHCDERGTSEYNLALGERRAAAARQFLADLGVDPSRLSTVSYGKEHPLDPRRTEEAWAANRRAEFVAAGR
ncbi:MAG: peptidoglycan-associated lipoprotein Pal [Deferrisomatales bacterium]